MSKIQKKVPIYPPQLLSRAGQRRPNFRKMPLLEILESRLTVSVLEDVDVRLSEVMVGLWLLHFFVRKSPNDSRVQYKYLFLCDWILFKINGVKGLFGLSL